MSSSSRTAASAKEQSKIFVGGLSALTSEDQLREHFETFGDIVECTVMRDTSGHSRCFGFLTFADPATVDAVVRQIHILDGKQIDPKPAVPRALHDPSFLRDDQLNSVSLSEAKVFVGGLHPSVTEAELLQACTLYGPVVDARIMQDKELQRSKGFGFVIFSTKVDARKAASTGFIEINGKKAEIKLALPKTATATTTALGKRSSKDNLPAPPDAVQVAMAKQLNNGIYDHATLLAAISYVNQHYHYLTSMSPVYPFAPPMPHIPFMPPFPPMGHMPPPPFPPHPQFMSPPDPHGILPFPFDTSRITSSVSSSPNLTSSHSTSRPPSSEDLNRQPSHSTIPAEDEEELDDPDLQKIYGESVSKDLKRTKTKEKQ